MGRFERMLGLETGRGANMHGESSGHSQREKFREECDFYTRKCQQRLYRTCLSCKFTLDHLRRLRVIAELEEYKRLLDEALQGIQGSDLSLLRERLIKVVFKSHFLNLKVNFEYFLNRMLYCIWSSQFERLAHQKGMKFGARVTLREFSQALSGQGGNECIIGRVVPSHGLKEMNKFLRQTTGKSLYDQHYARNSKVWSQIHTAFEVRHLIEHRKGKVNDQFLREVPWKNSSWADFPVVEHAKIEVREGDFTATFEAMVEAVESVNAVIRECWV
jgi:hypothetical protein